MCSAVSRLMSKLTDPATACPEGALGHGTPAQSFLLFVWAKGESTCCQHAATKRRSLLSPAPFSPTSGSRQGGQISQAACHKCVSVDGKRIQMPVAGGRMTHPGPASTASNSRPEPRLPVISPKGSHATQEGWQVQDEGVPGKRRRCEIVAPADPDNRLSFPTQKSHFCPSPECRWVWRAVSRDRPVSAAPPHPTAQQSSMVRDRQRDQPFPCSGPQSMKCLCDVAVGSGGH